MVIDNRINPSRIYVTWTEGALASIKFSFSTNGGASFSTPREIGENQTFACNPPSYGVVQYSTRTVGLTNNEVYVTWIRTVETDDQGMCSNFVKVAKSSDGGNSFPQVTRIKTTADYTTFPGPVSAVNQINGYIFIVYREPGNVIKMLRSTDGGVNWNDISNNLGINTSCSGAKLYPWVIVSPTGVIQLTYICRVGGGGTNQDVYLTESFDNGNSFSTPLKISSAPSIQFSSPGGGPHYLGSTSKVGTIYPCWSDYRNGHPPAPDPFVAITWREPTSSTSNATTGNSQRKVIRQSSGTLHMVFETNQEIWYARKSTTDLVWNSYQRLSSGIGGGNSYPCITERSGNLYAVWQKANVTNWDIVYSYSTNGGTSWLSNPSIVSSNFSCPSPGPTPSIIVSTPSNSFELMIAYRTSTAIKSTRSTNNPTGGNWSTPIVVANTNSNSKNPSLTYRSNDYGYFKLVWEENSKIYYENYYPDSWSNLVYVSNTFGAIANESNPTIALVSNNDRHIAWQGTYNGQGVIVTSKNLASVFTLFKNSNTSVHYYKPSLTGHINGRASFVWHDNANNLWKDTYNGTNWVNGNGNGVQIGNNGFNPTTSIMNPPGGDAKVMWTEGSSSPYSLRLYATTLNKLVASSDDYHRMVIVGDSTFQSYLSIEIGKINIIDDHNAVQAIEFLSVDDSKMYSAADASLVLETVPFTVSKSARYLQIASEIETYNSTLFLNNKLLNFEILDANTGTMLAKFGSITVADENDKFELSDTVIHSVSPYELPIKVRLQISDNFLSADKLQVAIFNILIQNFALEKQGNPRSESSMPKQFVINHNHPNPFNPSATIEYALPVNAHVALKIYNLIGQEVAMLVDETQTAGYKTVYFNASKFPSGVYFARLSVLSLSGKQLYQETKKLVLMK